MYYHAYNCSIFAYIVRCCVRTQQTRDIDPMVGQRRRRCANVNPPCPVRSDRQTTSLTLTTGVCEAGTKRRGCEQHEYSL